MIYGALLDENLSKGEQCWSRDSDGLLRAIAAILQKNARARGAVFYVINMRRLEVCPLRDTGWRPARTTVCDVIKVRRLEVGPLRDTAH